MWGTCLASDRMEPGIIRSKFLRSREQGLRREMATYKSHGPVLTILSIPYHHTQ